MNCQPGDLAIVVEDLRFRLGDHWIEFPSSGRLVQVVQLESVAHDRIAWLLAEHLRIEGTLVCGCEGGATVDITHIGDEHLRPLPKLGEGDQVDADKPVEVTQ